MPSTDHSALPLPPVTLNCCASVGVSTATRGTIEKPTPVPLNAAVCGEPDALSVIARLADRAAAADGVNVTVIVHDAPPARLEPHVLVFAKSPGFAPVIAMLLISSVAL